MDLKKLMTGLENKTLKELVTIHNELAEKPVKRFGTKDLAKKRIEKLYIARATGIKEKVDSVSKKKEAKKPKPAKKYKAPKNVPQSNYSKVIMAIKGKSNGEAAKSKDLIELCKHHSIALTPRQVSKFRNHRGLLYQAC